MGVVRRAMRIQVQVHEFGGEMGRLMLEAHSSQMSSSDNSCPGNGVEEVSLLFTPWSLSNKIIENFHKVGPYHLQVGPIPPLKGFFFIPAYIATNFWPYFLRAPCHSIWPFARPLRATSWITSSNMRSCWKLRLTTGRESYLKAWVL